jgi:hypothetical protein
MARDPRKNSAFDSGMRGREKPKVSDSHGGTFKPKGTSAGNEKQQAGGRIGDSTGVDLSAYTSGMRGPEAPKQKRNAEEGSPAGSATYGQERNGTPGGESKQGPNTLVGRPDGRKSWSSNDRGPKKGVQDSHIQATAKSSHDLGIPGNNTELASQSVEPEGEAGILGDEDDTHINLRIPKASLRKKQGGVHAG